MWSSITQRRNNGRHGRDAKSQETQFIELTDGDCKLLVAAGLKIQKGASPRDLYCFQSLPAFYDGTPLQVLRLLEEVRTAGRLVRSAATQQQAKRQRLSVTGKYAQSTASSSSWKRSKGVDDDVDVELLEHDDEQENAGQEGQLPELIKIRPTSSVAMQMPPTPVKGSSMYDRIVTPVKPSASRSSSPVGDTQTPETVVMTRRSQRGSMKIDVVSAQEETGSLASSSSSSRKRKNSESPSKSTSPLAALFSPHAGIKTPSPGLKTRRSSVLKQFETPDQNDSDTATPPTAPAPPKRFSLSSEYRETVTKRFTASEWEDNDHEELLSDGLADDDDDDAEDDTRACCDVKSVVEPIWGALQRTSSRFQNAWEEVRGLSSSLVLVPVCDDDDATAPHIHVADDRADDGAVSDLLVFQGDSDNEDQVSKPWIDPWAKPVESGGLSVRTRRQRREIRRLSAASTWRLW